MATTEFPNSGERSPFDASRLYISPQSLLETRTKTDSDGDCSVSGISDLPEARKLLSSSVFTSIPV